MAAYCECESERKRPQSENKHRSVRSIHCLHSHLDAEKTHTHFDPIVDFFANIFRFILFYFTQWLEMTWCGFCLIFKVFDLKNIKNEFASNDLGSMLFVVVAFIWFLSRELYPVRVSMTIWNIFIHLFIFGPKCSEQLNLFKWLKCGRSRERNSKRTINDDNRQSRKRTNAGARTRWWWWKNEMLK